jgi:hypothetical protein
LAFLVFIPLVRTLPIGLIASFKVAAVPVFVTILTLSVPLARCGIIAGLARTLASLLLVLLLIFCPLLHFASPQVAGA